MSFRLMFVCRANVCRSPTAQLVAQRALRASGLDVVDVASAGLDAALGSTYCEWAANVVGMEPDVTDMLRRHEPTPVDPEVVASADLILVAESAQRIELIRRSGGSAERVFTLEQAVDLAVRANRPGMPNSAASSADERLRALIDRMEALRPRERRRRLVARHDIADPHESARDIHPRVVREITMATQALVTELARAARS